MSHDQQPDEARVAAAFRDSRFRPGTRWWWQAPLTEAETVRELRAIAEAGFGEVEIAFSEGAWGDEAQRDNLRVVLEEAARLGVTVSMTMGAAWPVRTPNTGEGSGLAALELQYGWVEVSAGSEFSGAVPAPFDAAEFDQPRTLVAVTAARVLERGPAAELLPEDERPYWGTPVRVPEASTVLAEESLLDLTDQVDHDTIHWRAPKGGDHLLFAFWVRENRRRNTNPFDAEAARAAGRDLDQLQLGGIDAALLREVGGDFFEDSLELNAQSVFWSPKLADEFERRRGYKITNYLPLIFQHGMSSYWVPGESEEPLPDFDLPAGRGSRIRADFYRTLTDLYVDDHLQVVQEWAASHGLRFKAQVAYGQDLEPIRSARELARAGGRVESESLNSGDRAPTSIMSPTWRFALQHQQQLVSGAHQAGTARVSTELGAQFGKAYELGLGDLQRMMDKEWAAGITRPFLHGFAYQGDDTAWPTHDRFGGIVSDSWHDRTFPQWPEWQTLNDYWARGTEVLESGTAKADVVIYRDGFLTTAARGPVENDVTAPSRLFNTLNLERNGYLVEWLDPVGLAEPGIIGSGELFPDGPAYRALIIDERALPTDAAQAIAEAAGAGVAVIFVGAPPTATTTFSSGADGDARVRTAVARALDTGNAARVETQADVAAALRHRNVTPRAAWTDAHLLSQLRRSADTSSLYLYNPTEDSVTTTISLAGTGSPTELELRTGDRHTLAQFSISDGRTIIPVRFGPLESKIIILEHAIEPGLHVTDSGLDDLVVEDGRILLRTAEEGTRTFTLSDGRTRTAVARPPTRHLASIAPRSWHLMVETRQPPSQEAPQGSRTIELTVGTLVDWRNLAPIKGESGVGTYTGTMIVPADWTRAGLGTWLDLGRVDGTAEIFVNGERIGSQVVDGVRWDLGARLRPGPNELRIVVRTTLRNAVTGYRGESTITQSYGLRGPVTLVPYTEVVVHDPAVRP